jgi:hypothetical protein
MRKEFYRDAEGRTYAAPQYGKEITVKVGNDLDKPGTIALTQEAMDELGVKEGDIVELYGAWMQEVTAVPYQNEEISVARLDKASREALPCAIGQDLGIRKKFKL